MEVMTYLNDLCFVVMYNGGSKLNVVGWVGACLNGLCKGGAKGFSAVGITGTVFFYNTDVDGLGMYDFCPRGGKT